jgi:hypothetical protein
MKYTKEAIAEAWKILEQYRGKNIAAAVNHVSRSGMSRRIEFYAIHDDDISRIGYLIARVTGYGYDVDKGGIRADGCGMDMRFSILSNFNYSAYRHDLTEKGYDTEKPMHLPEACALMDKPQGYRIYDDYFFNANHIRDI